jgi:CRP-like cAMP-binding protein
MISPRRLSPSQRIDILRHLSLFSRCSKRDAARIAEVTAHLDLPAGTVLTAEGEHGGVAYVLMTGSAEVTRAGTWLAELGPGDVVGELSLIDGRERSATVVALTDVEVLTMDRNDLRRLLRDVPSLGPKLLEALALRLRAADRLATPTL